MGWEQHLREMVLAGGALAVTACSGSTSAQPDAASSAGTDATSSGGDDQSSDDAYSNTGPNLCCNANPDPCCPMACSGGVGPDAAIYIDCEQGRTECEAMNGFYEAQPGGSFVCTPLGRPNDAGVRPADASPTDAADADTGTGPGEAGDAGDEAHD